jgi:chorismate synthase
MLRPLVCRLEVGLSLHVSGQSVDLDGQPVEMRTKGRHDPCVGVRATPIAEAMVALTLIDHALRHRAQNADVASTTPIIPAQTEPRG